MVIGLVIKTSALLRRLLFAMKNVKKSPPLLKATFEHDSFRYPASKPILHMFTLFLSKIAASPTNVFSKTRGVRNYFRQWGRIFHSIFGACLFIFFFQISWRIITMLPDTILRCFIKSPALCIKLPDKFLILFPKQNLFSVLSFICLPS